MSAARTAKPSIMERSKPGTSTALVTSLALSGVYPTALALAVDHAFGPGGLHRIEVNIRGRATGVCWYTRRLGGSAEFVRYS